MKKIIKISTVFGLVFPVFAFAATGLGDIFDKGNNLLGKYIIPMLMTLAVVYFIWGVIQYTLSADDEAKKGARTKVTQGLIGLFVIISFWGIVRIFSTTFGLGNDAGTLKKSEMPCVEGYCNN